MDYKIQKQDSSLGKTLVENLQVGITTTGSVDVSNVDKFGIGLYLKKYKDGSKVNYLALFDIPKENRIPAMAERNLGETIKLITVAITLALETMNLKRSMTAFQILDLAEAVVDEAESDSLSIEDLMIFLQKLTRGEYPEMYEGIDQAKFMQRFNIFRDERWEAGIKARDERHEYYKKLGDSEEYERNTASPTGTLGMQLEHYRAKIQARKDDIIEQKRYNK